MNKNEFMVKIKRYKWVISYILVLSFLVGVFAIKNPKDAFTMIVCMLFGFFSGRYLFTPSSLNKTVLTISKKEITINIKDPSFLAPVLVVSLFYISRKFLGEYMNLSFLSDFSDLFILTLTLILVFGTFCLLSFNLISVLRDFRNRYSKEDPSYTSMNSNIDKSIKSGLFFLSATIFSSLGCLMLYGALILCKININSFLDPLYQFLVSFGFNEGYYITSILFILLSVYFFIRGIISILKIIKVIFTSHMIDLS